MIHLHRDEHGDRDVYTCPTPSGTVCAHEGPHDGSRLIGQIVKGRTRTGIRHSAAFEFIEWQWIPDDPSAERGPIRRIYSRAFEDARLCGSTAKGPRYVERVRCARIVPAIRNLNGAVTEGATSEPKAWTPPLPERRASDAHKGNDFREVPLARQEDTTTELLEADDHGLRK